MDVGEEFFKSLIKEITGEDIVISHNNMFNGNQSIDDVILMWQLDHNNILNVIVFNKYAMFNMMSEAYIKQKSTYKLDVVLFPMSESFNLMNEDSIEKATNFINMVKREISKANIQYK